MPSARAYMLCVYVHAVLSGIGLVASTTLQVLWSSARVELVVKGAVPTIARGRAVSVLDILVVPTLSGRQDLAVAGRHGVTLGMGVVDHRGELSATGIDEPVGNLI